MKLDYDTIKTITKGAVNITKKAGCTAFYRFDKAEFDLYKERSLRSYKTAHSSAGIEIVFFTDSKTLSLSVETKETTTRHFFSFDISVNNTVIGHIKNFDKQEDAYKNDALVLGRFSDNFKLGPGKKQVRIDFPWSVEGRIVSITVDDGAFVEPVEYGKKILVLGDSIAQGYDSLYPRNHYIKRLETAFNAEIYNKAVGGEMFWPPLAASIDKINPDYIIVAYGTNDWCYGESRDRVFNNCKLFYERLSKNIPNGRIFAVSPIWREDAVENKPTGNFYEMADMIEESVKALDNVQFIDGIDFVPMNKECFSDVCLHPNDNGFVCYADALLKAIDCYC